MAKVSTNISLDAELKRSAQELFADFGIDLTTAVTLFLKQAVREQRIPFEIRRDVPNAETRAALDEYKEMKKHPENYKHYSSFKEAMDEVLDDA
ncbi:MAG: type II toxin-antitoxin system RelB/DinJ family antitoxin [Clostridia bacterium]|nr:type II toxin-antitoxin system RelB/DinJ family antitoxin [Oscillospiraceae bacterium]MBO4930992.1 type II toxin-antitoxin system RelB/DinJ family antitoxin [Clostridia bacterium]MBP3292843.1 type II toxin-antitoxin system RelB/DinJ family antitoxin [Clostridia bacterium]